MNTLRSARAIVWVTLVGVAPCGPIGAQPAPPGHVVITQVTFNFMPQMTGKEIPGDGISTLGTGTLIFWTIEGGSPPPNPTITVSWTVVDGDGQFEPASKEVALTANPQAVTGVVYRQPGTPSDSDWTVTGRASAGSKSGEDTANVRGVSLDLIKIGPEELYSGTETSRATCQMYVRAYCPSNSYLAPTGEIQAVVGGQGVWLKWGNGATNYAKTHQEDLTWQRVPGVPPGPEGMMAQFTVAADREGELPTDPVMASFSGTLNGPGSPVHAGTQVPVLVPQTLVHSADAYETIAVKSGHPFEGQLVWYAEKNAEAKYYWGAKGTVEWQLPQGAITRTYRQRTYPPETPVTYQSETTTNPGPGTRYVDEEHGYVASGPVRVTPNPKQWAEDNFGLWEAAYTVVQWIEGTAKILAKWFR